MNSIDKIKKYKLMLLIFLGAVIPFFALVIISKIAGHGGLGVLYRPDTASALPNVKFSILEQLVICFASFGIKPLYELVSLIIVIKTWHDTDIGVVTLRYGLIAFFIGENACALNYLLFRENSLILEYLHLYGMLVCFSFVCYSALITLDRKILRYSDTTRKCRLQYFCKYCYKYNDVSCTIVKLYQLFAVAMIFVALLPLTSISGGYFVTGNIFGSDVVFGHSLAQQILETRIYPIIAILFFALAWIILQTLKEKGFGWAKTTLSIGLGTIGFSLMRFIVFWGFERNPIWADIWEETTEFLFISAVFYLLFMSRTSLKKDDTK